MSYPIEPTIFANNPYQDEWYDRDYMMTPDGLAEFPKHHCKLTFEVSRPFIKSFRNAIDVGCRYGEYSRYLHKTFEHVYAFDANTHAKFAHNVDLANVTHFGSALGDEIGEIVMYGGAHIERPGLAHTVAVNRLDDFGLTEIDYIKVDVEGFEKKVLIGGAETIKKWRPLIIIEQNDVRLADEEPLAAKTYLESLGYTNVAKCPRGWDYIMAPN